MRKPLTAMLGLILTWTVCLPLGAQEIKWDTASLLKIVQPMRHTMSGRLPLLLWNIPLPRDDRLVAMRADGSLRRIIDELAMRGIVPTVEMGWEWTPAGAMAMALTLQEAGRPVNVLQAEGMIGGYGKTNDPYEHTPTVAGPWPWDKNGNVTWKETHDWPILPIYDVSKSVAYYTEWMLKFKQAGVNVTGVWTDWEGLPNFWNFAYEAQKVPEAAKYYPPGTFENWNTFASYIGTLRAKVLSEAIVDPVHKVFPKALVGNYSDMNSSLAAPAIGSPGDILPPIELGRLSAAMPSIYADTSELARYYNLDWPVTPADVDQVFFTSLGVATSSVLANKRPGLLEIPYVSQWTPNRRDARYMLGMSHPVYREWLRHLWLRGMDGMYLYNLGFNESYGVSAEFSFQSIENARSVMDEMLGYREFLEKGKPMNFDLPALRTTGIVWSGLALPDQVLVRTFTFGPETKQLDLIPFPGVAVKLDATNRGATYLIGRDGKVRRVRTGLL
jgi:hypothetical protein